MATAMHHAAHCTRKPTRRLTRHSATLPLSSVTTLISLAHAPLMPLTDSAHFFLTPANTMVGEWVGGLMSYLILTGAFACGMAFHNTAARYFYSLGRERVFPASLGKTHPVYKSPYVASLTQ